MHIHMVSGQRRTKLLAAAALAVGLALRLWFVAHAARIDGDTLIYGNIAKNLLTRGVYGFSQTTQGVAPTLIRLPGYPLFLAACFKVFGLDHYMAVMRVQCVIDLATCLLAAGLARRLFGGRAGMAALWLGALCPFTAAYAAAALTETLTLATIALAFYSLARWRVEGMGYNRWLWGVAAALACSLLLRPEQGLLAAAVLPAMLWMGRRGAVLPVAVVAVCVALPLVPWTARNWRTFHVFQPLAPRYATDPGERVPLGFQRWYRTWAIDFASTEQVYWNYDGAAIEIGDLPARAFDVGGDEWDRTAALLEEYNRTFNATPRLDAGFAELARERVAADPVRYYLALPVARLLNMLLRPRVEMMAVPLEWWKGGHPGPRVLAAGYGVVNLGYLVLGGVGFWLWWRRGRDPLAGAMMGFVVLRCALLLTIDNSEPRYTLEFFPLLFVWGSVVFAGGLSRAKV